MAGAGGPPEVQIIYEAIDKATATIRRINEANERLEKNTRRLGGGARGAGEAFSAMAGHVSSAVGFLGNLTLAVQGAQMLGQALVGVVQKGIQLNATFEQTKLQIAGNLKAFDLAPSMDAAVAKAEKVYFVIEKLAAALPGETEDYLQVFKQSLPQVLQAFRSQGDENINHMADFVSRWTAVMISGGIDASQAGRDLVRIMSGRASLQERSFSENLGLIEKAAKQVPAAAKVIAEAGQFTSDVFNKLDKSTRLDVLRATIEQFNPMLGRMSNTQVAIEGTLATIVKEAYRTLTKPAFNMYLKVVGQLNEYLEKNKELLSEIATEWGQHIADGAQRMLDTLKASVGWAKQLRDHILEVGGNANVAHAVYTTAASAGMMNVSGAAAGAAGVGAAMGASSAGPVGALVGALIGSAGAGGAQMLANNPVAEQQSATSGVSIIQGLIEPFTGVIAGLVVFGELLGRIGVVLLPLIDVVVQLSNVVLLPLRAFGAMFAGLMVAFNNATEKAMPKFLALTYAIRDLVVPVLRTLGYWVEAIAYKIGESLGDALGWAISAVGDFAEKLAKVVNWITKHLPEFAGSSPQEQAAYLINKAAEEVFKPYQYKVDVEEKEPYTAPGGPQAPDARAKTVYDFRGSRFDITQQFAEGFDPDRIASAFASDLARLGEMKRQSSLAQLYAVR